MRRFLKRWKDDIPYRDAPPSFYTTPEVLLYFFDMFKDAMDTFKPYKTKRHLERDLYQFFYGLKNTIVGLFCLLWAILLNVLFGTFVLIVKVCSNRQEITLDLLMDAPVNLLGALAQTIRGGTQILASPASLLRIIWRSYLSQDMEEQKFQQRKSIIRLVDEAEIIMENAPSDSVEKMSLVLNELHRKLCSNLDKKQSYCEGKHFIKPGDTAYDPRLFAVFSIPTDKLILDDELKKDIRDYLFMFSPS